MPPDKIQLRPYQKDCIEKIKSEIGSGKKEILIQLGTGAGKTVIFSEFVKELSGKTLILTNKVRLVSQAARYFKKYGLYCASLGKKNSKEKVTIATVQSFSKTDVFFDTVIVDEIHSISVKHLKKIKRDVLIGFSGTPFLSDGSYIFGEDKFFKDLAYKKTFKSLTDEGYLCPIVLKDGGESKFNVDGIKKTKEDYNIKQLSEAIMSDTAKVQHQVEDAIKRSKDRNKVAFVCCTIEHAELVYSFLPEKKAITHSKREENLGEFENGDFKYMVSVLQITTGYDYPPLDCLALMRPTRSPVLYCQTVGRLARLHPSKKNGLLLDYGRVVENLGSIYKVSLKKKKASVKICPECESYTDQKEKLCSCGYHFKRFCNVCGEVVNLGESCCKTTRDKGLSKELTLEAYKDGWRQVNKMVPWHYKAKSGNPTIKVDYFMGLDHVATEYFLQYQKQRMKNLVKEDCEDLQDFYDKVRHAEPPSAILIEKKGSYKNVIARRF